MESCTKFCNKMTLKIKCERVSCNVPQMFIPAKIFSLNFGTIYFGGFVGTQNRPKWDNFGQK